MDAEKKAEILEKSKEWFKKSIYGTTSSQHPKIDIYKGI